MFSWILFTQARRDGCFFLSCVPLGPALDVKKGRKRVIFAVIPENGDENRDKEDNFRWPL